MDNKTIDINEYFLYHFDQELLSILLQDHSSGKKSFGRRITTPKMGLDMVTIFGYSAPKSDIEAVGMLKSAWGDPTERALEEIEIIDLRPEDELYSSWEEFIHTPLLLP